MEQSFEAETYRNSMRTDLNLIYTLSNLISTLIKIDTPDAQGLAMVSAQAIYRSGADLIAHIDDLYRAREAIKPKKTEENKA